MSTHSSSSSDFHGTSEPNHSRASTPASKDQGSEYKLLQGLGITNANFACGGSLKVTSDHQVDLNKFPTTIGPPTAAPVTIRWDGSNVRKIQLPSIRGKEHETAASLVELLADCTPATFGHGGKDILDESYRKAAKLDNTQFSTNFHPHDYGILAAISQTLLPSITKPCIGGQNESMENWGLVAELYKLNIYSSPSGKFQAHVDTPRGPTQFGSLVVSLPYPHQGGGLRVAHNGQEILYDWSNTEALDINWAAFYSDCEHEVLEVTSGHRITLTYNLYISEHLGSVLQQYPNANPTMYPLYEKASSMLDDPDFLKEGGLLGFYCTHRYAHTNEASSNRIHYALKGLDAVIFATFHHGLGLEISFRPILEDYRDSCYQEESDSDDMSGDVVGTGLHSLQLSTDHDPEDSIENYLHDEWPSGIIKNIRWLNSPTHKEVAFVHLTYGNETSMNWHYSSVAMLITVPSPAERATRKARHNAEVAGQSKNTKRKLDLVA